MQIDNRHAKTRDIKLCDECISYIPEYIGGVLRVCLGVPEENFHSKFQYPPIELCWENSNNACDE